MLRSAGSARTHVVDDEQDRVGYYALTVPSLEREEATGRASRGMPMPYSIPAVLLARLFPPGGGHRGRRSANAVVVDISTLPGPTIRREPGFLPGGGSIRLTARAGFVPC
jgi:hypothetical protein